MPRDHDLEWPEPREAPVPPPADDHRRIPLDDLEDGRYLEADDPRRLEAERVRGRPFTLEDVQLGREPEDEDE